jgi:hypothetical protein
VIAYTMTIGGKRISSSLTTMEFRPAGNGTRLIFTEQDVFLDGFDHPAEREQGTRELLDKLGEVLARQA